MKTARSIGQDDHARVPDTRSARRSPSSTVNGRNGFVVSSSASARANVSRRTGCSRHEEATSAVVMMRAMSRNSIERSEPAGSHTFMNRPPRGAARVTSIRSPLRSSTTNG